ncbi:MAG: OsmC family protein [Abditibacteriaceae bacterium]
MAVDTLLKVETTGKWTGGVQTSVVVRSFEPIIVDEPVDLGGANQGPNPVELVLAGLSSCTSVMIAIIAKEQDFIYDAVNFSNSGELDLAGLMGAEGVSPHFQSIDFTVEISTSESNEKLQLLQDEVEKRCPVMNLLRDAKIPVTSQWIIQ